MANKSTSKREQELLEKLRRRPDMMNRLESIMQLAEEPPEGEVRTADEVEALLVEEIRKLGNETMSSWATSAESKVVEKHKALHGKLHQREKKR